MSRADEIKNSIIGNGNNYAGSRWKNVTIGIPPEALHAEFEQFQREIFSGIEERDERLVQWANQYLLSKFEEIDAKISQKLCKEASPDPLSVSEVILREEIRKSQRGIVNEIRGIIGDTASTVDEKISQLQQGNEKIQSGINRIYGYCEEILSLTKAITKQLGALDIAQNKIKEILQISIDTAAKRQEEIIYSMNRQYDIELNIQAQQHLDSGVLAAIFDMVKKLSDKPGRISDERDEISKFISDLKTQNCEFAENIHALVKNNNEFRHIAQKIMDALIATSMPLWGNGLPPPAEMLLYRNTDSSNPNPCPFCGAEYSIHFETDGRCSCRACGQEFSNLRSDLSDEDLSYIRGELRDLCPTQTKVDSWRNGHTAKLEPIDGQAGHYKMSFDDAVISDGLVVLPDQDSSGATILKIEQLEIVPPTIRTSLWEIHTIVLNPSLHDLGSSATAGRDPFYNWAAKKIILPSGFDCLYIWRNSISNNSVQWQTVTIYPEEHSNRNIDLTDAIVVQKIN